MIRLSENNLLPKLQYRITFTQSHYDKFSCLFIFWTVQPELFAPWVKFTNSLTFLGYTPLFMARGKHTKSTQTISCYWKSLLLKHTQNIWTVQCTYSIHTCVHNLQLYEYILVLTGNSTEMTVLQKSYNLYFILYLIKKTILQIYFI